MEQGVHTTECCIVVAVYDLVIVKSTLLQHSVMVVAIVLCCLVFCTCTHSLTYILVFELYLLQQ